MSRKVSSNFPFEQLTPGQSKIHLIFHKGIPNFNYDCIGWDVDNWWQSVCKIYKHNSYLWDENVTLGHHPTYNVSDKIHPKTMTMEQLTFNFCTFAHRDLSTLISNHTRNVLISSIEVSFPSRQNPSFTYLAKDVFVGLNESLDDKEKMVRDTIAKWPKN